MGRRLLDKLHEKNDVSSIMGIEGFCSNIYFRSFGKMVKCDKPFTKRNRRPPRDPVNIVLSLGYTLLTREVESALETESLETYLGFLHGIRYGRRSLALDIVEEFRQPVIDRLTLKLFNKRILTLDHFEPGDNGLLLLTEDGFKKFCTNYEKWLTGRDRDAGEKSFRNRIHEQAAILKKCILAVTEYIPYSWSLREPCT